MMKRILYIISFLILIACSQVQTNEKDIKNVSTEITLSEIEEFLKPQIQIFTWSVKSDTLITCEKGTKIYFPKNCIDTSTIDANKPITIEVKEYYNLSEFISERLTTLTKDKILETGGMVNIDVQQGDKSVQLKKDSKYGLFFPKDEGSNEFMQTFQGKIDSNKNVVWELDQSVLEQSESTKPMTPKLLADCELNLYSYTSGFDDDNDIEWVVSTNNEHVPRYIKSNLNPSKKLIDEFCGTKMISDYSVWYNIDGSVKKIDIEQSNSTEFDSLFINFIRKMPPIKVTPLIKKYINRSYGIALYVYRMSSFDHEEYASNFKKKYESFKDEMVSKVDKAELNYYVLAASSFGWINCDRFWETDDEKIDYLVEVQNMNDVNLNLVFSDINSIMPATKVGNNYVFKDVPVGREVKLVCIGYDGESAALAVNKTKITDQVFRLSSFKNFKLTELEKELNSN